MFVGRTSELTFLEECFEKMSPQLIVLYGRDGVGKTSLAKEFVKDKPFRYKVLNESNFDLSSDVKKGDEVSERSIIIYDDFEQGIKNNKAFFETLSEDLSKPYAFVILISSSVNWVENDMVGEIGSLALRITSFLKLKEFSLMELISRFPKFSLADCIRTYSVTGGVPSYLDLWNEKQSFKDNVTRLFLCKNSVLKNEANRILKNELRELPVYNTILYALANGMTKLNDINTFTGYGRAKISVYIKNLIGLDIVEKVFSYDTRAAENTKKGVYRIKDFYMLFYYRYIFKNRSLIEFEEDNIYDLIIKDSADDIFKECYKKVCIEYLQLMAEHDRLPLKVEKSGSWYGKKGDIDYIGADAAGNQVIAFFTWDNEPVGVGAFNMYYELIKEAKISPSFLYLFAKEGFSEELKSTVAENVHLVALEEM